LNLNNNKILDKIIVILPAFNEDTIIKEIIRSLIIKEKYEIVVVDDGSDKKDAYKPILQPRVTLIRHKVNLGQGAALQTGIDFALTLNPSFIVTFDADGQHTADDIDELLKPLQNNQADITLGSRFLKPGLHNATIRRTWLIKIARWINYLFTGILLSDAHNGLRAMTAETAKKLKIKENRMAHATEILIFIKKRKLRFCEIPVTITYTAYSRKKGQSAFNSIRIFFDLVLHKLFE
jgi:polyprenyl-phospho-N-acetylgalactosaminyl synthase